jgi:SAM-dependent methyltransferase
VGDPADFSDVDSTDGAPLLAMMAATDAWPSVRAARSWTLEELADGIDAGPLADVGCGPGTFGELARASGWATVELDRSLAMLGAVAQHHGGTPIAAADVWQLPVRDASLGAARCERVLQWTEDPDAGLAELWRTTAPGGWVAVTDTDWSTFTVDAPSPAMSCVLAEAALGWVPHPTFAATMADRLRRLGAAELRQRTDVVTLASWDPDDSDQLDGPPGLPLHSIAAGAAPAEREAAERAVAAIASAARGGAFAASLSIVTVLARR